MKLNKILSGLLALVVLTGCGKTAPGPQLELQDLIWTDTLDGHGVSVAGTGLIVTEGKLLAGSKLPALHGVGLGSVSTKDVGISFSCEYEDYKTKQKTRFYEATVTASPSLILHDIKEATDFLSARNGERRFYTIKGISVEPRSYGGPILTIHLLTSAGAPAGVEVRIANFSFSGRDGKVSHGCNPDKLPEKSYTLLLQGMLKLSTKNLASVHPKSAADLGATYLGYQESGFTAHAEPLKFTSEALLPQKPFTLVEKTFVGVRKSGETAELCPNLTMIYQGETSTTDVKTDPSKTYRIATTAAAGSTWNGYYRVEQRNDFLPVVLQQKGTSTFDKAPNFTLSFDAKLFAGLPIPDYKTPIDRLAKFEKVRELVAKAFEACPTLKKE